MALGRFDENGDTGPHRCVINKTQQWQHPNLVADTAEGRSERIWSHGSTPLQLQILSHFAKKEKFQTANAIWNFGRSERI